MIQQDVNGLNNKGIEINIERNVYNRKRLVEYKGKMEREECRLNEFNGYHHKIVFIEDNKGPKVKRETQAQIHQCMVLHPDQMTLSKVAASSGKW